MFCSNCQMAAIRSSHVMTPASTAQRSLKDWMSIRVQITRLQLLSWYLPQLVVMTLSHCPFWLSWCRIIYSTRTKSVSALRALITFFFSFFGQNGSALAGLTVTDLSIDLSLKVVLYCRECVSFFLKMNKLFSPRCVQASWFLRILISYVCVLHMTFLSCFCSRPARWPSSSTLTAS